MSRFVLAVLLAVCANGFAFDHTYADYQAILDRYVQAGEVDYAALKDNRASLDAFIASFADVSFEQYRAFTKSEQLAFLINLYNAAALQLIINHYPLGSIRDIGGFFSSPWNKKFVTLFGHEASLGMIEHDILRADFKEPRIHFAIVGAARGGPLLPSQAYLDHRMSSMLAQAERHFLTERPNENRFENGELRISPIFKWFRDDFGGDDGVRTLFQMYYPEVTKDTRIRYTDYDWSLNSRNNHAGD
ncbi:DUF547 domain-containing protein [bacterium]|nr:DUF547 domain-containing protein [bacterium]